MKKKNKLRKPILLSLLGIATFGSISLGTTYALFTSKAETKVVATAGKVNVTSEITGLQTYSGENLIGDVSKDTSMTGPISGNSFTNGGTASIDNEKKTLTLTNITPGDKVTFNIVITNNSNVDIKYQTHISCIENTGLYGGLNFTIDGNKYDGLSTKSKWSKLSNSGTIKTLPVEVTLPSDANNKYQETSCTIQYTVNAIQANAKTTDPDENVIEIENASELGLFRDIVNGKTDEEQGTFLNGKTVKLMDNIDLENKEWVPIDWVNHSGFTFDGNDKTISNFTITEGDGNKNTGFFGTATAATIKNVTIDHATVIGINHVGALVGDGLCTKITGCTVKNSSITANTWWDPQAELDNTNQSYIPNYNDGDKVGAIVGYLSAEQTAYLTSSTAIDCKVQGYRDVGGLVGMFNKQASSTPTSNSVVSGNTASNITITNNREHNYKNYKTDAEYDVNNVVGETASGMKVENNTVDNVKTEILIVDGFTKVNDTLYKISNENGFAYWCNSINTAKTKYANTTIKLTADIDYKGKSFTPINLFESGGSWENMVFDGGDHKISNITVLSKDNNLGIFSTVSNALTIKNITFDNIVMDGRYPNSIYGSSNMVSAVVAHSYASLEFDNVSVTNSSIYGFGKVGTLVGMSERGNEIANKVVFKNINLENNQIVACYNAGGLMGHYQRTVSDNSKKVTINNVSMKDMKFEAVPHSGFDSSKIINFTNLEITCSGKTSTTCLGKGNKISGKYIGYLNSDEKWYYYGLYADYYISYGTSSHDCTVTLNNETYLIANSEVCVS